MNEVELNRKKILIKWLKKVCKEYSYTKDTLNLTIHYIEKICSIEVPTREKFQLMGITCLLIASKIEELKFATINDLVYVSASTYTNQEVLDEECRILRLLDFDLLLDSNKYPDDPDIPIFEIKFKNE